MPPFNGTMRRVIVISSLLVTLVSAFGSSQSDYVVNGWSLKVTLVPEKSEIMVGEPLFLAYRVENLSNTNLGIIVGGDYRNRFGRPERFTVAIRNAGGQSLPVPDPGPSFGGLEGPQPLPAHGKFEATLFLSDWGVITAPGVYSISVKRTLNLIPEGSKWNDGASTYDISTSVDCSLKVVPADHQRIGELIDRLGKDLLAGKRGSMQRLCAITDERTIPYFRQAAESRDYELKIEALAALGKFGSEEAIKVLEKGLATTWQDIANCKNEHQAESMAENIRTAAAQALQHSPSEKAHQVLIAHLHDSSPQIRLTAVHLLGGMKTEEAAERLRTMTNDSYDLVRQEAARYLQEMSSANPTTPSK